MQTDMMDLTENLICTVPTVVEAALSIWKRHGQSRRPGDVSRYDIVKEEIPDFDFAALDPNDPSLTAAKAALPLLEFLAWKVEFCRQSMLCF
jgi:hypothetical protein